MAQILSQKQALKENVIRLIKHHRKHCDGQTCNIALSQILVVAQDAGLKFTDKEKRLFY